MTAATTPNHLDASLPVADRIADLLGRMTVEEKIGQMLQLDAREDLEDQVLRRHAGSILHASPEKVLRARALTLQTRLRIPLLVAEDCIHGHSFWEGATIYPTQLGMAATWDAALIERVARATAVEVSATGIHWTFSPVLCITRDLRWGRVDETFGEDPFLIGELASAMVRGYQGGGLEDPTAILATAKHFAGYSETQGGRDASEADLSRRKLRSWFLPPFERVAREGCRTFMLGYQTTDGVPITVNDWLLNDVLRGEWGYRGTLITDWDNVGRMVWEQKVQPDYAHAAAAAVLAGNDMIMTTPGFFQGALDALAQGLMTEDALDRAVARILLLKFEFGLFEDPRLPDRERIATSVGTAEHTALNLEVARRSLVLLRNDGTLPLAGGLVAPGTGRARAAASAPRRLAVVGPLADDAQTQLGDWAGSSGQVDWMPAGHPRDRITTVLDGLRDHAPADWEIAHARGADILTLEEDPEGGYFPDGQPRPQVVVPSAPDADLIAEAVAAAEAADWVVAVVGDRIELVGEGRSTATLELVGGQIAMLEALAATGTPLIVVLLASKPHVLPPAVMDAAAVVWAANPGMRGGQAVAELLLGLIEPSGRLPVSFARHAGQLPIYYNQIRGQHGDRYADLTQSPAFAFGEGLSYTTVEYTGLRIVDTELTSDDTVRAVVELRNTGERAAREIVQVYVRDTVTSVSWADKELKAYRHVDLAPGASATVELSVPVTECTIVDAAGRRLVEAGEFELLVGPSSREEVLLSATFRVAGAETGRIASDREALERR
ncbi:glycoside hydrolase family 3 N-terminal domain-containing protein [Microbacterium sp. M3]|uniref:beta-glucosidase n=1 Tax=Microbacterium arthrosphaerae TaxID=792652 RepID=A0ABU4H0M6_9MICO|nr:MULTISPECIES: glycoside hydrolase family 3 N-terminal domain-containing protein [Microbacterium]MDW4571444.1 glycoside hydrolase family 3 N-terminal domain-containing protein [Microbacterium arthrosphaerae]MDW7605299.1 glycoside hydrolase family 3 N-terminal domain-containing protein [Microbacterium sp. M3]